MFPSKEMENVSELFPSNRRYGESNGEMNGEIFIHSSNTGTLSHTHEAINGLVFSRMGAISTPSLSSIGKLVVVRSGQWGA